ncbi:MAG: rRNA maturation RNase YbeY [Firmicutes bacterium]|nr:rRNA maturation RNase YbeY [Bacillota bacterium]
MEILYTNETEHEVDFELIKKTVKNSLEYEGFSDNTEISITVVGLDEIHQINLEHRGIDRPTDVLSFPLIDFTRDKLPENEKIYLGDIVLCYDKVLSQAEEYGHSVERELAFLTAHSMLHLMGYDHMVPEEEKVMFAKQEEILAKMGLTR